MGGGGWGNGCRNQGWAGRRVGRIGPAQLWRDAVRGVPCWWPLGVRLAEERAHRPAECLLPLSAPLSLSLLPPPVLTTSSWASPQQKLNSDSPFSGSLSRSRPPNSDHSFPHRPFFEVGAHLICMYFQRPSQHRLVSRTFGDGDEDHGWHLLRASYLRALC